MISLVFPRGQVPLASPTDTRERDVDMKRGLLYIVKPKARVTSTDKQSSMHAPWFGTQSKQSSKQLF